MTDIPSYGQFIKDAKPPPGESLNELVEAALKTIVKQAHALAQNLAPRPDEDREAQIESVQQDMDRVLAEFGIELLKLDLKFAGVAGHRAYRNVGRVGAPRLWRALPPQQRISHQTRPGEANGDKKAIASPHANWRL